MEKKIGSVVMGLVIVVLSVFLAAEGAEAFSVKNWTDKSIQVDQTSGGNFSADIKPNDKSDCHWTTESCNTGGERDSTVKFHVEWYKTDMRGYFKSTETICNDFPIKAGGWLTIEGSNGNYKCVRHDY